MIRRLYTLISRSIQSYGADQCSTHAAAIAYYAVFALFPIALVGVSVLGYFMGTERARDAVVNAINEAVALGPSGEEAVRRMLEGINTTRGVVGAIGLITAVWGATSLFGAIRRGLNAVWQVRQEIPSLRGKARELLVYAVFVSLLTIASISGPFQLDLARRLAEQAGAWGGLLTLLLVPVSELLPFAAFLFLFWQGTDARVSWRDVWPAALITLLVFELGKNLFTVYVRTLGDFDVIAGSLGAAILLLLFVNYSARAALFAVEFAKHRKLIRIGLLPAEDARMPDDDAPWHERVKEAVVRLWEVQDALPETPAPLSPPASQGPAPPEPEPQATTAAGGTTERAG